MLRREEAAGNEQKDFRALGLFLMQIKERETSLKDPNSLEPQKPDEWTDSLKDFLKKTAEASGQELQEVYQSTILIRHQLIA